MQEEPSPAGALDGGISPWLSSRGQAQAGTHLVTVLPRTCLCRGEARPGPSTSPPPRAGLHQQAEPSGWFLPSLLRRRLPTPHISHLRTGRPAGWPDRPAPSLLHGLLWAVLNAGLPGPKLLGTGWGRPGTPEETGPRTRRTPFAQPLAPGCWACGVCGNVMSSLPTTEMQLGCPRGRSGVVTGASRRHHACQPSLVLGPSPRQKEGQPGPRDRQCPPSHLRHGIEPATGRLLGLTLSPREGSAVFEEPRCAAGPGRLRARASGNQRSLPS